MYWLSFAIVAIILGGLYAVHRTSFPFTQIVLIQILLIFMVVNIPGLRFPEMMWRVWFDLAGRPIYITDLSRSYTYLSMIYLHGDFMHLLGNGLVLFFIGTALEDRMGKKKVVIIYFSTALLATLSHYFVNLGDHTPVLGASGAVFGLMGAIFILYPQDKIPMFLGPIFMPAVRVDLAVAVFVVMQTGIALIAPQGVAHAAHFGGFAAGMVVAKFIHRVDLDESAPVGDYTSLRVLVTDENTRSIYHKMMEAEHEDVRRAWAEHLISLSDCPECGAPLERFKCKCGFRVR